MLFNTQQDPEDYQRVSEFISRYNQLRLKDTDVYDLDPLAVERVLEQFNELLEDLLNTFPFLHRHSLPSPISPGFFSLALQKKIWKFHHSLAIDIETYTVFFQNSQKSILSEALESYPTLEPTSNATPPNPMDPLTQDTEVAGPILWKKLNLVQTKLTESFTGIVTCIAAKTKMVVGTSHGVLHLFNSSQQWLCTLDSKTMIPSVQPDAVTCIVISEFETELLSGHADGTICLWDIPSKRMIAKKASRKSETKKWGHLKGSKIIHLSFLRKNLVSFVSADNLGVAFHHTCVSTYLGSIETQPLFGTYQNRLNQQRLTTILSMVSIFDTHVALLSPYKMAIFNTDPIQTVYRLLRASTVAIEYDGPILVGSLCFSPPHLCMAWGNWFQIFKVDKQIDTSNFNLVAVFSYNMDFPIYSMKMLDNYLLFLDGSKHLIFFSFSSFTCLERVNVPYLIGYDDFSRVSQNVSKKQVINYFRSWECTKSSIYTFTSSCLSQGELLSFEPRIMAMAKAGNVTEAIHLALDVYHQASSSYVYRPSNPLDLVSSLCNMTLVCLRSPSLNPQSDISQLIHFCLAISAESFLYLDFYEEIQLHHYTSIFHDVILHLLKSKSLQRLSPSFTTPIFKNLVEAKMWKEFETMLSWMTLPMIDFDICFRVCRKYELHRGCLHLYRLSDQLVEGLTNMLPISSNAPFEFLLELSTLHLLNQKQIQSVMIWAQRHWEEAFILSPSFVLKYTKTLFQWSPPHLRQHLVDSLLEFRSDEFTASKSILIQLMLVHAKKDHPDHLVLSSQDLHGFFITWTHATPAETDLLHLDGFQQGLIYLLETLFYVKDHTVFQRVLQFSREHQLWNVCEYLYLQLNQPVFLLDCLLFDSSRQFRVFHAFPSLLQACPSEQAFWEHVLEVAQALIELSPTEFAMTLHQMNATDWISSIYTKVKDITTSLLPFLDTLTQFSPTLVSQTLFLHCLELNAQQKNDLQCVSLIEMHHLQFLCLDHCVTLCQRYDLKVSLSKVYDLQCNHEAALSLLLQSNQIHRLFEFCRHHEFAWVQVLCHYLNEPSNFLNMDMFTFLNHLPDPYYFVQSLHQIAWSPRLKKYLDHWTYSIRAKEIQQRLLLRIQQREWLTRVHRRQHQTQGIFIPSLQCLLCKNATSSIDVIWYGCGHGFHQHCLKTYYNSPQPDTWTECVKCSRTLRLPTMSSPTSDSSSLGTVKKHRALYVQHFSLPTDWFDVLTELIADAEIGPFLETET